MIKFILPALLVFFSSSAYSMDYVGVTAPFGFYENETHGMRVSCKKQPFHKLEFWARQSGKVSIPRLSVEKIELVYDDGSKESLDASEIWHNARGIRLNLNEKTCITNILITGHSEGIMSWGGYPIEVWVIK